MSRADDELKPTEPEQPREYTNNWIMGKPKPVPQPEPDEPNVDRPGASEIYG